MKVGDCRAVAALPSSLPLSSRWFFQQTFFLLYFGFSGRRVWGGGGAMSGWTRAGSVRPRRWWRLPMMKRSVAPVNLAAGSSRGIWWRGGRRKSLLIRRSGTQMQTYVCVIQRLLHNNKSNFNFILIGCDSLVSFVNPKILVFCKSNSSSHGQIHLFS